MRQIIPFRREILFNTPIGEIASISLEHTLKPRIGGRISGEFIISGQYKVSITSPNLEEFYYNIPFDIDIDDNYDLSNIKIDIDDFYYEVVNGTTLKVNIDIAIEGITERKEEIIEEETNEQIEESVIKEELCNKERCEEEKLDNNDRVNITGEELKDTVKTLFDSFDESLETFSTYSVYIVRENDTLESILLKYNKTREELADYNNLEDIKIGTKLIIPAVIPYE